MATKPLQTERQVAGVGIHSKPCPKCKSAMFIKPCPCFARRRGWLVCAQCINPKCRRMIAVKTKPTKGRKKR